MAFGDIEAAMQKDVALQSCAVVFDQIVVFRYASEQLVEIFIALAACDGEASQAMPSSASS